MFGHFAGPLQSLVLSNLTNTAGREPEHVLHQAVPVGMERDQLLLDELLGTLGGEAEGDGAETAAVVRTGNNAVSFMLSSLHILQISLTCRLQI